MGVQGLSPDVLPWRGTPTTWRGCTEALGLAALPAFEGGAVDEAEAGMLMYQLSPP